MNFFFHTNNRPVTLMLKVKTNQEQEIRIVVEDPSRVNTKYTDRVQVIKGERILKVRMPLSPESALVHIYNTAHGPAPDTYKMVGGKLIKTDNGPSDPSFAVSEAKEEKLVQNRRCYDSYNRDVKEALLLIEEFSERAGWLSAGPSIEYDPNSGSVYRSDKRGKFIIRYVDVIIDWNKTIEDQHGNVIANPYYSKELITPARINWESGVIEVSKKHFTQYTIPERIAILLHEFSHKYRAKDITNEVEADLHGALIYLAEGFPRIELFKAYYTVFDQADTAQNRDRKMKLEDFVENFEKMEYKLCA